MQETWVQFLGQEDPLEEEMTTQSSICAWKIPWTEEPGGLHSMGSQNAGHNWARTIKKANKHIVYGSLLQKPEWIKIAYIWKIWSVRDAWFKFEWVWLLWNDVYNNATWMQGVYRFDTII